MKVLVVGLPGSGKTTQAKLLASYLDVPRIGSGDLLRELVTKEDDDTKEIREIMASGGLVSDEMISRIVGDRVAEDDCQKGFVMEGYPRTQGQLKTFDPKFDKVIYLNLDQSKIFERLSGRGRNDDNLDVIKKRLDVQFEEMQRLIDYYKTQGILIELSADTDIDSLHNGIKEALNG